MTFAANSNQPSQKVKVNWVNECVVGALVSTVFTLMAANSGMLGVEGGSLADRVHSVVVVGGISMAILCTLAAIALLVLQILEGLAQKTVAAVGDTAKGIKPISAFQAAKFVKIFLP